MRQAVNYAVDTDAIARIYGGLLASTHQILPPGIPGYSPFDLYPHSMARARELIAEAQPSDKQVTVWVPEGTQDAEATEYYARVLRSLGFKTKLKTAGEFLYFSAIGKRDAPSLDTGWADWFEDYPHPNDFFQPMLSGNSILPLGNENFAQIDIPSLNETIERLDQEPLGPQQEAEYAALDRSYMEQAPWVPYGSYLLSTFVSRRINLKKVVFNPTFGDDLTSFRFK